MWYKLGYIADSKGIPIIELDTNKDLALIFGQAVGIAPTRISDHYATAGYARKYDKMMDENDMTLRKIYLEYYSKSFLNDVDLKNVQIRRDALLSHMNSRQISKISKMALDPIINRDNKEYKALLQAMERHIESGSSTAGTESLLFNKQLSKQAAQMKKEEGK